VNRQRVRTLAEFFTALRSGDRGFTVGLIRGDFNLTLTVR
jgi:hypothetical protein